MDECDHVDIHTRTLRCAHACTCTCVCLCMCGTGTGLSSGSGVRARRTQHAWVEPLKVPEGGQQGWAAGRRGPWAEAGTPLASAARAVERQAQGDRGTASLMPRRRHVLPQPGWGLPRGLLVLRTLVCTVGRGRRGLRSFSEPGQACLRSRLMFTPSPWPQPFPPAPTGPSPNIWLVFPESGGWGSGKPICGAVWESPEL